MSEHEIETEIRYQLLNPVEKMYFDFLKVRYPDFFHQRLLDGSLWSCIHEVCTPIPDRLVEHVLNGAPMIQLLDGYFDKNFEEATEYEINKSLFMAEDPYVHMENEYHKLVDCHAQELIKQLTDNVIEALAEMDRKSGMMLSDEDSNLDNVWMEICDQVQGEESIFWDSYLCTIHNLIWKEIIQLSESDKKCLWLQTDEFDEEEDMYDEDGFPLAFCYEDICEMIKSEVLSKAADCSFPVESDDAEGLAYPYDWPLLTHILEQLIGRAPMLHL